MTDQQAKDKALRSVFRMGVDVGIVAELINCAIATDHAVYLVETTTGDRKGPIMHAKRHEDPTLKGMIVVKLHNRFWGEGHEEMFWMPNYRTEVQ